MPELLLTYDFPPIGGGIARWMSELARRYPPGELIVSTGAVPGVTQSHEGPALVDRVAVPAERLRTVPGLIRWARRAAELVRRHDVRFVWCGTLRPAAYPAWWLARRFGIPYGVIIHGGDLLTLARNYRRSARKRWMARTLLGSAAVLVANSDTTRDRLARTLGDLGLADRVGRIHTVPLGADPERFGPDQSPPRAVRRLGGAEGRWLLTVARLVPHKGVDVALRAMALLIHDRPDLRYAVVGTGPEAAPLRKLAQELGLTDRVHFAGAVPDGELPAWYALAEIYVGLSRELEGDVEGFGIAFLEAAAAGRPAVAGDSGGVRAAVQNGVTGILVDPTDPKSAARAIDGLLRDPARARSMGDAGRREVERYYNWDRVVADLRAISQAAATAVRPGSRS